MTMLYPNELDIHGFCPVEAAHKSGDLVVDRYTGTVGRVTYVCGIKGVYSKGVFYEIKEDNHGKTDPSNL